MASLLGEDHEFSREMLQQIKDSRSDGNADLSMSLEEFKAMMMKNKPEMAKAHTKHDKRRHQHAPVSKAQYAQQQSMEKV